MTAQPKPLMVVMDDFIAHALIRFHNKVEILSALDLLHYGGDDWPQPHPWTGMPRLPWEDWPSREQLEALRDRIRGRSPDGPG